MWAVSVLWIFNLRHSFNLSGVILFSSSTPLRITTGSSFLINISSNVELNVTTIAPAKNNSHVLWQSKPWPRGDITKLYLLYSFVISAKDFLSINSNTGLSLTALGISLRIGWLVLLWASHNTLGIRLSGEAFLVPIIKSTFSLRHPFINHFEVCKSKPIG